MRAAPWLTAAIVLLCTAPLSAQGVLIPRRAIPRPAAPTPPPAAAPAPASTAPARDGRLPRIGIAAEPAPAPAPPVVYVVPQVYYIQNVYGQAGSPYLVLSDGSVLVNFGYGYERVLRSCALVQPSSGDPWARDALGRIPEPPAIASLRIGARGQLYGSAPPASSTACYRNDAQGRVEVVTLRY